MRFLRPILVLLLVLSVPFVARARTTGQEEPTLETLGWLCGAWCTAGTGPVTEEVWMAPIRGLMLGMNRSVPKGRGRPSFEFMRIEAREGGIFLVANPSGQEGAEFELLEASEKHAVFVNPEHDFPQTIIYRRRGEDGLFAEALGADEEGPSWTWKRVPLRN